MHIMPLKPVCCSGEEAARFRQEWSGVSVRGQRAPMALALGAAAYP